MKYKLIKQRRKKVRSMLATSESHNTVEQKTAKNFSAGGSKLQPKSNARNKSLPDENLNPVRTYCTDFANGRTSVSPKHPHSIALPYF